MRVKSTPRAQQRARSIKKWWRENRPGVEQLFDQEYEDVMRKLAAMAPRSPLGKVYKERRGRKIWRVLLPKTQQHLYYSIDEATDTAVVRTFWGARRGRSPQL